MTNHEDKLNFTFHLENLKFFLFNDKFHDLQSLPARLV